MNWNRVVEGVIIAIILTVGAGYISLYNDFQDIKKNSNIVSIPSKMVAGFNRTACPNGWVELPAAQGRYLVGLASGGTLAESVGEKLTPGENRVTGRHSHNVHESGLHSHSINRTGGSAGDGIFIQINSTGGVFNSSGGKDRQGRDGVTPAGAHVHTLEDAGQTTGTNAPYIQLLFCEKS